MVTPVWSALLGQPCLVTPAWSPLFGHSCLVSPAWSALFGQPCCTTGHHWAPCLVRLQYTPARVATLSCSAGYPPLLHHWVHLAALLHTGCGTCQGMSGHACVAVLLVSSFAPLGSRVARGGRGIATSSCSAGYPPPLLLHHWVHLAALLHTGTGHVWPCLGMHVEPCCWSALLHHWDPG